MSMLEKIKKYYLYFMMYAVIGWLYEVFLEVVIYRWGFSNRGVLFGPYCPVYGFGALSFIFILGKFVKVKDLKTKLIIIPLIFLGCMIIATTIELFASYLCEWTMGSWPWQTYVDYDINFQGRIALNPSIRFGLGGVFFLYVLQPLFEKVVNKLSKKALSIVAYGVGTLFLIDVIVKVVSLVI